jgi:restriction endonuclease S subunit
VHHTCALPPLDEQCRIAAHLDMLQAKADIICTAQLETQKALNTLMPGVLNRVFRGEL